MNHILFTCPYARLVWALSLIPAPPSGEWTESLYANVHRILSWALSEKADKEWRKAGPWILWRLWKSRNNYLFRGEDLNGHCLVDRANGDVEEWSKKDELEDTTTKTVPTVRATEKWTPPPQGWLKCNVDGSWDKTKNQSRVGWILRDHSGTVIWCGARGLSALRSPIEAEAEALRWAILSMIRLSYTNIIFESDCKELVQALYEENSRPHIQIFIEDSLQMLHKIGDHQVVF